MQKNYLIILLMIALIAYSYQSNAQVKMNTKVSHTIAAASKEEKLARLIVESFRKKDDSLWRSLFPSNEEYRKLLQLMLDAKMEGLTQAKINDMIAQRKQEAVKAYNTDFKSFIKQADSLGINWKKTEYKNFIFETYKTAIPGKYLNGDIWLLYNHIEFVIEGVEAVETSSGFKLQSIKGIRRLEEAD